MQFPCCSYFTTVQCSTLYQSTCSSECCTRSTRYTKVCSHILLKVFKLNARVAGDVYHYLLVIMSSEWYSMLLSANCPVLGIYIYVDWFCGCELELLILHSSCTASYYVPGHMGSLPFGALGVYLQYIHQVAWMDWWWYLLRNCPPMVSRPIIYGNKISHTAVHFLDMLACNESTTRLSLWWFISIFQQVTFCERRRFLRKSWLGNVKFLVDS